VNGGWHLVGTTTGTTYQFNHTDMSYTLCQSGAQYMGRTFMVVGRTVSGGFVASTASRTFGQLASMQQDGGRHQAWANVFPSAPTYSAGWTTVAKSSADAGTLRQAKHSGRWVEFQINAHDGQEVALELSKGVGFGDIQIQVDGVAMPVVMTSGAPAHDRMLMTSFPVPTGQHRVRVITMDNGEVDFDGVFAN
jgi:hypothetical protein